MPDAPTPALRPTSEHVRPLHTPPTSHAVRVDRTLCRTQSSMASQSSPPRSTLPAARIDLASEERREPQMCFPTAQSPVAFLATSLGSRSFLVLQKELHR